MGLGVGLGGSRVSRYQYVVTVETDTQEHAEQVMAERLEHDEQYTDAAGVEFDYRLPYARREGCANCHDWYDRP